ncbi:class I SAM-dependent methyltransferase [Priestia megaterium]|nr:class I SAM-dependent methyltransferase [Priestia megaterium]
MTMGFKDTSVYDNHEFFKAYISRRNRKESPNNIIEKPVLLELMGDVTGKTILDLGCGDARFGYELIEQGCYFYEGVEGSVNMINEAVKMLNGTNGKVHYSLIEDWNYPEKQYDLVTSRLALHYLAELESIFKQVYNSLKRHGRFIFSIQRPASSFNIVYKKCFNPFLTNRLDSG